MAKADKFTKAELIAQRDAAVEALQDIHSRLLSVDHEADHGERNAFFLIGYCRAGALQGLLDAKAATDVRWAVDASAKEAALLAQMAA